MRRRHAISATFVALAALASGCGGDGNDVTAGAQSGEALPTTTADYSAGGGVPVDDDGWEPYVMGSGGFTGTRTSFDGRSLLVTFVGGAPYVAGRHCTVGYRAEVTELASEVVVRLFSNSPPPPDEDNWSCTAEGYFRSVEVYLDAALGDRTVVEAESLRRLEVFDGSLLAEPRWMPDGWGLRREQAGYPEPERASYWERTWGPEPLPPTGDVCTPTDGSISLTQGPASGPDRDISYLEPISTHDVNGAAATYYEGRPSPGNQVALGWEFNDQDFLLRSGPSCSEGGAASVDRLLQFARGLELPSS